MKNAAPIRGRRPTATDFIPYGDVPSNELLGYFKLSASRTLTNTRHCPLENVQTPGARFQRADHLGGGIPGAARCALAPGYLLPRLPRSLAGFHINSFGCG